MSWGRLKEAWFCAGCGRGLRKGARVWQGNILDPIVFGSRCGRRPRRWRRARAALFGARARHPEGL